MSNESHRTSVIIRNNLSVWSSVMYNHKNLHSIQFSSVTQSCPTLCNPMDYSTPCLPVHELPGVTQTHVLWVSDAIQPSHPLPSPFPPAFNLSQHQGLFQWAGYLHQVVKILEFQLQHQSFQYWFPLGLTGLIFLQSKGLSRVFSSITVQKHQFFGTQSSLWYKSHIRTRCCCCY